MCVKNVVENSSNGVQQCGDGWKWNTQYGIFQPNQLWTKPNQK